jgi:acyl carrier protein
MIRDSILLDSVREVVIEAIEQSTGFLNDRNFFNILKEERDLHFSAINLDSLSKSKIILAIEERLGLALDADEVGPDVSIESLARLLTERISPVVARTLLP